MSLNISIIGSVGIPARYGGFETLAENLVTHKSSKVEYTVFCSTPFYSEKQDTYCGATLKYIKLHANGMSSMLYDLMGMLCSLHADAMLILGVSGCVFLPLIRLLYRGKIITNIDGIEWRRDKWNAFARFVLRLSEKIAVKYSDTVIVDNQGILEYVKKEYGQKATLIEYGADGDTENRKEPEDPLAFKGRYAITICRIEPENNIHLILQAFAEQTDLSLVIIGNWKKNYYGQRLFKKYSDMERIRLLDPIYDTEKIYSLRLKSYLYIHGHSAGGTNPSLVEAMYAGLPVFAFDCVYNRYSTENRCKYWSSSEELRNLIVTSDANDLMLIGKLMKEIADRRYRWNIITSKYEALYPSLPK